MASFSITVEQYLTERWPGEERIICSCLILYLRSLCFKELNFSAEKEALICFCVNLSIVTNFEFQTIPVLIVKGFEFNSKSGKLHILSKHLTIPNHVILSISIVPRCNNVSRGN